MSSDSFSLGKKHNEILFKFILKKNIHRIKKWFVLEGSAISFTCRTPYYSTARYSQLCHPSLALVKSSKGRMPHGCHGNIQKHGWMKECKSGCSCKAELHIVPELNQLLIEQGQCNRWGILLCVLRIMDWHFLEFHPLPCLDLIGIPHRCDCSQCSLWDHAEVQNLIMD